MNGIEDLLTKQEIRNILTGVENNPQLRIPNVITLLKCGRDLATIMWVSSNSGLIWIKGNGDTGLEHISNRHSWNSTCRYWRSDRKDKLDNPSRFQIGAYPIKHFSRIAEDIYQEGNINNEKNKKPELFEIYDGLSSYDDESEKTTFRLIVYKDTKIVHTLIPLKGEKKVEVDLVRGNCKGKVLQEENELLYVVAVPYRNQVGEAIFSFQLLYSVTKKHETGLIVNHLSNESFVIYERTLKDLCTIDEIVESVQLCELRDVERIIKKEMKSKR